MMPHALLITATLLMQPTRDDLQFFQVQAERQGEIIRLRDEWLQAARTRLWARQERLRDLRSMLAPPPPYVPAVVAGAADVAEAASAPQVPEPPVPAAA